METIIKKSLDHPDDVKTFEKLEARIVAVEDIKFKLVTAQPGWQWSISRAICTLEWTTVPKLILVPATLVPSRQATTAGPLETNP
jgi:hypothetical protein